MSNPEQTEMGFEEAEVEKPDPFTLLPDLYEAAKANDTDAVVALLEDGVPAVFVEELSGWTALHWAAMNGNVKVLEKLLEKGASQPYHHLKAKAAGKASKQQFGPPKAEEKPNAEPSNLEVDGNGKEDTNVDKKRSKQRNLTDPEADETEEEDPYCPESLLKNTPLLWAAFKGHLRVLWMLLVDGYSPNDVDSMGNNSLHLAAVNGHLQVLNVLIEDGGNANMVNFYKNRPIDMAMNREIRDALAVAMEKGASYTEEDVRRKHEQNMAMYNQIVANVNKAIVDAKKIESSKYISAATNFRDVIRSLYEAIREATELRVDENLVSYGNNLMKKLEAMQDLLQDSTTLQKYCTPMRTQDQYVQYVHKLEKSIERARAVGVEKGQIQASVDVIGRCNIELWMLTMASRLRGVTIAKDSNEHDMNRLKQAVLKAQALKASDELIDDCRALYERLNSELSMYRALQALPMVRVPPAGEVPEGYWQDCDKGHIQETDGYPLPPPDGVYLWEPSEAFSGLSKGLDGLKKALSTCDVTTVNPALVAEAKEKVVRGEKDAKLLEAKDAEDKQVAIDAATKLAKKLKKAKKKKETKD